MLCEWQQSNSGLWVFFLMVGGEQVGRGEKALFGSSAIPVSLWEL